MTTVAELTLPTDEFALAATFRRLPGLEVRVESVVAEGPARTTPLVWFSNVAPNDLEATLETDPTVEQYRQLLENTDRTERLYRLRYGESVDSVCRAVYANGGTVLGAWVVDDRWTLRLLFPLREELSEAVSEIEGEDVRVDVRRMVEAGGEDGLETTAALTEPQQEAIAEAYRRGYYDVPRAISLEELANELDISHQALSERLRRANRVLASEQLEGAAGEVATD
ncbi:helix-turn-helix domain-containing protein [Natronobacterium gregoryi]|uniref:Bacterio-opsin activator n=2 Tax=Natronobacterium gregoryi TaxID=44930 RepID=L0AL50_NATGS|nr:helix-turn-helix domain-containing protein [Natronobacterium gregoryi]AFZ74164.1 putative DNA binding protein [Natronobacterium gregoryi SP2]ELY63619.1 Bacterio-opsin activator HTH domain-containing protein [Natronobacterium gregoryi SP2]PLK22043.1 bacterio-opsin activator [Natronobacterium gregoryi SP2]SFI50674.1 Predicted DNA binding protein, contains HTH domain [Natronobacterium gregoryi]